MPKREHSKEIMVQSRRHNPKQMFFTFRVLLQNHSNRVHSKKGIFQKEHIPKRAHSKKSKLQRGNRILQRQHSVRPRQILRFTKKVNSKQSSVTKLVKQGTFQKGHIPKRLHSKKGTCQKGHITKTVHSKESKFRYVDYRPHKEKVYIQDKFGISSLRSSFYNQNVPHFRKYFPRKLFFFGFLHSIKLIFLQAQKFYLDRHKTFWDL